MRAPFDFFCTWPRFDRRQLLNYKASASATRLPLGALLVVLLSVLPFCEARAATPPFVTGTDTSAPSSTWRRPALGKRYRDPNYRRSIRRMGNAGSTRFERSSYSRRQAESARARFFLTYRGDGTYRVYERRSRRLVRSLTIHEQSEPQWHPRTSAVIRHLAGPKRPSDGLKLFSTHVINGRERLIADLGSRIQKRFPNARYMRDLGEGSPSADGNRYAWIVHDRRGTPIAIASYDLVGDRLLGLRPVRRDLGPIDWVSTSPTGRHVVISYARGTFVFDRQLRRSRRIDDKAEHADIALDVRGRDVLVKIAFSGEDDGWLVSTDLGTLRRQRLFSLYETGSNTSLHVSGKAYKRPGWAIVSSYDCKSPGGWLCNKVVAVELKPNPRILNLAHTYNCGDRYWSQTQATVNPTFRRVYFNSDAGRCGSGAAEVYELSLPRLP